MAVTNTMGPTAVTGQQAGNPRACGRNPMTEAACGAAQTKIMQLLAGLDRPKGPRNADAFKTAVCGLEKAGCSVGLRKDVDRLELELTMPDRMAGSLPREVNTKTLDKETPLEQRTSFEVINRRDGMSTVRVRPVETTDCRRDPTDPENAPKVLKLVLESLGMAVVAKEVGELLRAPEKVQNRAEAAPQAARPVRTDEDTTGVFRNGVRIGPGAGSGMGSGVATPEGILDGTLQKLSALGIEAKII